MPDKNPKASRLQQICDEIEYSEDGITAELHSDSMHELVDMCAAAIGEKARPCKWIRWLRQR